MDIKVNSFRDKWAAKQLVRGLGVFGLSIDDLKNLKEIKGENVNLKSENEKLSGILKENGKDPKIDITKCLSKKESIK